MKINPTQIKQKINRFKRDHNIDSDTVIGGVIVGTLLAAIAYTYNGGKISLVEDITREGEDRQRLLIEQRNGRITTYRKRS